MAPSASSAPPTSSAAAASELLVGRRSTLLAGVGAGLAVGAAPALLAGRLGTAGPTFLRDLDRLEHGARSGEVTTDSAVLWARGRRDGRLHVRLTSGGRERGRTAGPWVDARTDRTGRIHVTGLAPGRAYAAELWFEASDGTRSERERVTFATAPVHAAAQSFVWSGDTCGQGWGINPELGGLTTYRAVLDTRPDFFLHCGDTIYADEPMEETVVEPGGEVWRNELIPEVTKVAETLAEFRGRHRYVLADDNVRALHAEVPTVVQWDDHETCNNWYPGELVDDDRFTERRADVLATRGRRAWQEYQPVPVRRMLPVGRDTGADGFAPQRLYRKVPRGQHLDLFCLDMRSWRAPNPAQDPRARAGEAGLLGPTQERWLIDSLLASRATWKVVSADLPLSIPSKRLTDLDGPSNGDDGAPLGREPEIARVLSALKAGGVRNVVWVTADVHYTAAHHYDPSRAAFTDFDPFWEFVSGPLAAGTFAVKDDLDGTFGPEVRFSRGNDGDTWDQSPRHGNQFFGHAAIAATGELTVTLHDGSGAALWSRTLEPDPTPPTRRS